MNGKRYCLPEILWSFNENLIEPEENFFSPVFQGIEFPILTKRRIVALSHVLYIYLSTSDTNPRSQSTKTEGSGRQSNDISTELCDWHFCQLVLLRPNSRQESTRLTWCLHFESYLWGNIHCLCWYWNEQRRDIKITARYDDARLVQIL